MPRPLFSAAAPTRSDITLAGNDALGAYCRFDSHLNELSLLIAGAT